MRIKNIDHFVVTTRDLKACLDFYVGALGMEHRESNGHHSLYFPSGKISIHTKKGEFQPAALHPTYGSQDFCLIVEDNLETVMYSGCASYVSQSCLVCVTILSRMCHDLFTSER